MSLSQGGESQPLPLSSPLPASTEEPEKKEREMLKTGLYDDILTFHTEPQAMPRTIDN